MGNDSDRKIAARSKLRELEDNATKLRAALGENSERARDRERKRTMRAADRDVLIPEPADLERREKLEAVLEAWLRFYMPDAFSHNFTPDQLEMAYAIRTAAETGLDQAIAGARGDGKTTITEGVTLYCVLTGLVSFAAIFSATGADAERVLSNIRRQVEENDQLAADYPEACVPVRALEYAPQKAGTQTVSGRLGGKSFYKHPVRYHWCGGEVIFPNVPGSRCARAIIATRGLDGAVRGLKIRNARPDLAVIDDPDTDETAASEEQTAKLERKIERTIAGLAGQEKELARVMLTTLRNRKCVSARYTDSAIKPSWNGRRFKFVKSQPAQPELWEEYISLRQSDQQGGDRYGRRAHRYYLDHREEMEQGAEVSNPNRFDARLCPDGTPRQVSALQRYWDFVADKGIEAALCELQNDPPEESAPIESGISGRRIQSQVSGYARKIVPPGCKWISCGIDCRKLGLHFVVRAWRPNESGPATGYMIDYGFHETHGTIYGSDEGLDDALVKALHDRREAIEADGYTTEDGQVVSIGMTLVDAGWRTEAVYRFCREAGLSFKPAMGFGKSAGCAQANFNSPVRSSPDKKIGFRWFLSRRPSGVWLCCMDADHWKSWEHDRWMTDPTKPGTMLGFGYPGERDKLSADQKGHFAYAKHLTAEIEIEEVVKGVLKRRWKSKSDTNHYLDASYMSDVAASMLGVPMAGAKPGRGIRDPMQRPSAADVARGGR